MVRPTARVRENGSVASVQAETGRRRREDTRRRLLAATRELLERGRNVAGLPVATICEQAGISRATFYLHYDDKRALFADLAATELAEWTDVLSPLLGDPAADRARLRAVAGELVAMWLRHEAVLGGIVELTAYDDQAEAAWRAQVETMAAEIEAYLRRRDPDDARDLGTLTRTLTWSVERSLHKLAREDPDRLADALTEIVWPLLAPA